MSRELLKICGLIKSLVQAELIKAWFENLSSLLADVVVIWYPSIPIADAVWSMRVCGRTEHPRGGMKHSCCCHSASVVLICLLRRHEPPKTRAGVIRKKYVKTTSPWLQPSCNQFNSRLLDFSRCVIIMLLLLLLFVCYSILKTILQYETSLMHLVS